MLRIFLDVHRKYVVDFSGRGKYGSSFFKKLIAEANEILEADEEAPRIDEFGTIDRAYGSNLPLCIIQVLSGLLIDIGFTLKATTELASGFDYHGEQQS